MHNKFKQKIRRTRWKTGFLFPVEYLTVYKTCWKNLEGKNLLKDKLLGNYGEGNSGREKLGGKNLGGGKGEGEYGVGKSAGGKSARGKCGSGKTAGGKFGTQKSGENIKYFRGGEGGPPLSCLEDFLQITMEYEQPTS